MKDKKLIYDTDSSVWTWGQYKLINLTIDDPQFSSILATCNLQGKNLKK